MDNTVTLVGNVTRDAELRFTPSGQAVASFGLAVNRRWQNKQSQEWEEQVSFIDVTCWGTLGENVSASLQKGSRAIVTGRLEQQTWEKDGQKHSKIQVVADEVGPSLRWATTEITRNERKEGGGSGGGGQRSQSQSKPQGQSGGGQSYGYDEEPF